MLPNTITTLGNLEPGDVFIQTGNDKPFMKVDALPVRKSKHLYECAAVPVGASKQKHFKANTEVQYLFTSLSIV